MTQKVVHRVVHFNPRAYVRHDVGASLLEQAGIISIHVPT